MSSDGAHGIAKPTEPATEIDPRFGHRVLSPKPSRDEIEGFYRDHYYKLIDQGERAADIARERQGGDAADDQARWLRETVHQDIIDLFRDHAPGKRTLDVGCGMGVLMDNLARAGFDAEGAEIAPDAAAAVSARGRNVHVGTLPALVDSGAIAPGSYDGITFIHVLDHTHEPALQLAAAARALKPGGVLILYSGNDFNPLQEAAVAARGLPRWWIKSPDHIHYFSHAALARMLDSVGLTVIDRRSDFPMELFLLLGFDFISDRALGGECHQRRVAFERALPAETRRSLYRALAQAGMGRCCFMAAQKPPA